MSPLSLTHEDRLRPIARVGRVLWFFSTLDGCLYSKPPTYVRHRLPVPGPVFVIRGDERLYRPRLEGDILAVDQFCLALQPVRALRLRLPAGGNSWKPIGVVATEQRSRSLLLRSNSRTTTTVDLSSGQLREFSHPAGFEIARVLDAGTPVLAGDGRFLIPFSKRKMSGSGTVVSGTSRSVLIEQRTAGVRVYRRLSEDTEELLHPPRGWRPMQGALEKDGAAVFTCLHPERGYGLWHEGATDVVALPGTPQLFGLEDSSPVIRVAGVAEGSAWLDDDNRWAGAVPQKPDIAVEVVRIDGMPCIHLRGKSPRAVVIAFHGGPDSHEWDDLRYGGVYRELIARRVDVLVVNATGSAGFGQGFQRAAWDRWPHAAESAGGSLASFCDSRGYLRRILFGVSFGAWFAALSAEALNAYGIVALAPVLQLAPHLVRHGDRDASFERWARERFGVDYRSASEGDGIIARSCVPLATVIPEEDEVVLRKDALPLRSHSLVVTTVSGRHYPRTTEDAQTRWATILSALVAFVDDVREPPTPVASS